MLANKGSMSKVYDSGNLRFLVFLEGPFNLLKIDKELKKKNKK